MKLPFTLFGLFLSLVCVAQTPKTNRDSSPVITRVQFDVLVDSSIKLLETKPVSAISDSGHIHIMMCLNTILMSHSKDTFEKRFAGGRYQKLQTIADEKKYVDEIGHVYHTVISRGMGMYFPKLDIEFYGTPYLHSWFNVTD